MKRLEDVPELKAALQSSPPGDMLEHLPFALGQSVEPVTCLAAMSGAVFGGEPVEPRLSGAISRDRASRCC